MSVMSYFLSVSLICAALLRKALASAIALGSSSLTVEYWCTMASLGNSQNDMICVFHCASAGEHVLWVSSCAATTAASTTTGTSGGERDAKLHAHTFEFLVEGVKLCLDIGGHGRRRVFDLGCGRNHLRVERVERVLGMRAGALHLMEIHEHRVIVRTLRLGDWRCRVHDDLHWLAVHGLITGHERYRIRAWQYVWPGVRAATSTAATPSTTSGPFTGGRAGVHRAGSPATAPEMARRGRRP